MSPNKKGKVYLVGAGLLPMFDFTFIMLKTILVNGFIFLGIFCFMYEPGNCQTEPEKKQITSSEYGDLEKLYKELKKQKKDKDIEIYYTKETIIKEPQEQDEYLKHLLEELKKSLKKGKKWGTVRRVEGGLVEIDKGAVHKVHERDVYIVRDSSNNYKSKIEIEAIADAISIGTSYEQKKKIEPGDTVKFRGQRRLLALGLICGSSEFEQGENYKGCGMIWKYTLRGGWSFESFWGNFERYKYSQESKFVEPSIELIDTRNIYFCIGARKYFYYPSWISPFIGLGGSYMNIDYSYADIQTSRDRIVPYFLTGVQLSLQQQLHFDLEARYFHGPKLNVEPEPIEIRPTIYCASISFTW